MLVWGRPDQGPRSRALARELGITTIGFIVAPAALGRRWVLLRYALQAMITVGWLLRHRPRVVVVQAPPSFAAWITAVYCRLTGGAYVIDAHSAAFQVVAWQRPRVVTQWVARHAVATIATDPHWASAVRAGGGEALVIPDVPTDFTVGAPLPSTDRFRIAVVNTWAPDEPIEAVFDAARQSPEVEFAVTGSLRRAPAGLDQKPPNLMFTDFLSEPRYHSLLAGADAVMCLTTRDHTMQRGACEALSHGRPIITSDQPLLRSYFRKGAVLVQPSPDGIRTGIERLRQDYGRYQREVLELREEERARFRVRRDVLIAALLAGLRG